MLLQEFMMQISLTCLSHQILMSTAVHGDGLLNVLSLQPLKRIKRQVAGHSLGEYRQAGPDGMLRIYDYEVVNGKSQLVKKKTVKLPLDERKVLGFSTKLVAADVNVKTPQAVPKKTFGVKNIPQRPTSARPSEPKKSNLAEKDRTGRAGPIQPAVLTGPRVKPPTTTQRPSRLQTTTAKVPNTPKTTTITPKTSTITPKTSTITPKTSTTPPLGSKKSEDGKKKFLDDTHSILLNNEKDGVKGEKFGYKAPNLGHTEATFPDGVKVGEYFWDGPDGYRRIVTYYADEDGFKSRTRQIKLNATEEPPTVGPLAKDEVPVTKAGVPVTKAGAPVTKAGAPVTKAGAPVIKAGAPVTKDGAPVTKAGAPVTKDGVPVTKTDGPERRKKGVVDPPPTSEKQRPARQFPGDLKQMIEAEGPFVHNKDLKNAVLKNCYQYQFEYNVETHWHNEVGFEDCSKEGQYGLYEEDGRKRVIDYVADATGFHPKVKWETSS